MWASVAAVLAFVGVAAAFMVGEDEEPLALSPRATVLTAISDRGNAIISESVAVANYNTLLAELDLQTGTILETHGLVFHEEQFLAAGPLGRLGHGRDYPSALVPMILSNIENFGPGERQRRVAQGR